MIITIDIAPDVEGALVDATRRRGQTPEEAAAALRSVFASGPAPLDALLAENALEDGDHAAFTDFSFLAGAEATRHIWDTPEEDAASAHLQ